MSKAISEQSEREHTSRVRIRPLRVAMGMAVIIVLLGFLVLAALTYREATRAVDTAEIATDAVATTASTVTSKIEFLHSEVDRAIETIESFSADEPQDVLDDLVVVPDLSGLSHGDADYLLKSVGLEPDPSYRVNTEVPENTVFTQTPPAGQRIEQGSTVALTVSQEIPRVPPVRGRARVEATEILRSARYEVIVIEDTSQAAAGIVVGQEPSSNTELAPGEAVTITVSTGPGQIFVPDVRGQTLSQAIQTLIDQGFRVGQRRESSTTVAAGDIITTDPPHGFPASAGLEVYIIISDRPPRLDSVEIPDLVGRAWDAAQVAAELGELTLGLAAVGVETDEYAEATIIRQAPAAGSLQRGGITVTVEVAVAPGLSTFIDIPSVIDGTSQSEADVLVPIPDVQGLLFDTGKLAIERAGLVIGIVTFEPVEPGSADAGRILAQTPPPNLEMSSETPVDVVVGESS